MVTKKNNSLSVCGGCNAKIGPGKLSQLLADLPPIEDPRLLVGFDSTDDAGVIKISEDQALIQTLDFFPSMVADPYLFGQIAATNALSDVYAMGGDVLTAMNIVCFPEGEDLNILGEILRGGVDKIKEAGAMLVGGHSIHDSTPKYGLSVTGVIHPNKIIKNNSAQVGDLLILTKPLGVGMITSAYGAGKTSEQAFNKAVASMTSLNKKAAEVIRAFSVNGCTDVTGFGLLGHLYEMINENNSAVIYASKIPYIAEAYECAENLIITTGGKRNREYLKEAVVFNQADKPLAEILFDPQTSGGLLISLPRNEGEKLIAAFQAQGIPGVVIGEVVSQREQAIYLEK